MGLRFVGFGLAILCLGSLTACETKISQCNQLITIVNRTSDDLSKMQTDVKADAQTQNAEQMAAQLEQFVGKLEKNTKDIEAIGVDQPLQPYKQKLVTSYKTALNNSRALAVAIKSKNQPAAQAALNALTAAGTGEAKLLKEIGDYCQAPQ